MSSLYLDRKNLGIKLDGQALALYEDGARKGSVPLHFLDRVVLRGNVQLESRVLGALSERNIGLLVLSSRNTEATAMLASRAHSNSTRLSHQYGCGFTHAVSAVTGEGACAVEFVETGHGR